LYKLARLIRRPLLRHAQVAERIHEELGGDVRCIFSDDNAEKLILRLRIINPPSKDEHGESVLQDDEDDKFLKQLESNLLATLTLQVCTVSGPLPFTDCP
jgi:DNA-directed RNA polymerase II subunit RPB1